MAIEVATAADLDNVRNNLGGSYIQTANIDLSGYNWVPIGTYPDGNPDAPFTGSYNGQGYIINNLTINRDERYQGLFQYVTGNISNVLLRDVSISMSGILSYANPLVVYLYGSVTGCSATGAVSAYSWASGLVGIVQEYATLATSYSKCNITCRQNAGGLVAGTVGAINNCYSRSNLLGWSDGRLLWSGGFVSDIYAGATITNAYCAGSMLNDAADNGGFSNQLNYAGNTVNSYWDASVSGYGDSGMGEGRTTAEMTHPENFTTTYIDWDFVDIWKHDPSYTINDGYPHFGVAFNIWVKKGGEWIQVTEIWVKKGGVWQAVTDVSTLKGGNWNTV